MFRIGKSKPTPIAIYVKCCLMTVVLLSLKFNLGAQFVNYGSDPASIRWSQIKSPQFQLIFPSENEQMAKRYMLLIDQMNLPVRSALKPIKSHPIPVILHSYSSKMNGMVSWAPRRMELLPTPYPDFSFQPTEKQLPLHELAHVAQMDKLSTKLPAVHFVLGQQAIALASIQVPVWFFEGDAVSTETALSSAGRGREAFFLVPYRARQNNPLSFDQWSLGSFKHYTHDYYALGYLLTAYARMQYGKHIWASVLDTMQLLQIPAFAKAMGHTMQLRPKGLFKAAITHLHEIEQNGNDLNNFDAVNQLSQNKTYAAYTSLRRCGENYIAVKKTLDKNTQFILIDSFGSEKALGYVGQINSTLAEHQQILYWTEYVPDIRWQHRNYSVLKKFDLITGKRQQISKKTRYFAPTVSKDGLLLAVFEPTVQGASYIRLIDTKSQQVVKSLAVPYNRSINHLAFDSINNLFASVIDGVSDKSLQDSLPRLFKDQAAFGNGLAYIIVDQNTWEYVIQPTTTNISGLYVDNGKVLFESGYSGINNIFEFDPQLSQLKQLTNTRYGVQGVAYLKSDSLIYGHYTSIGYQLVKKTSRPYRILPLKFNSVHQFELAESLSDQEGFNIDTFSYSTSKQYLIEPYKKRSNLFQMHSWAPYYIDINSIRQNLDLSKSVQLGASVWSQNKLNTLTTQVAYYYKIKDRSSHAIVNLTYQGFLPILYLKADIGGKQSQIQPRKINTLTTYQLINTQTVGAKINLGSYLPLVFTNSVIQHGMQIFADLEWDNKLTPIATSNKYRYTQTGHAGIYYYRYLQRSHRDLQPRLGFQSWLHLGLNPVQGSPQGRIYASQINVFLPGFLPNAGLKLGLAHQYHSWEAPFSYYPNKILQQSRSFTDQHFAKSSSYFTSDYQFYIACPDWSFGSILYLPRIRSGLFFDHSWSDQFKKTQIAFGSSLLFDVNWLRVSTFATSLGVRAAIINHTSQQLDFLFQVNL